ncbi:tripartite tricarboxylate transporter substrate binding protein [Roseomonas terrae]|uniref:Tripartite tricarboxylate transporter substrate binding protein n=1 Tax=Neoroseomonas terrae TaxID=424799 RepID=A0ABS5EE36_9PROT|nr:tripartite tricarboxylate transporter substrate binding protein [Neoroseomonas terrae]MBR0649285.1 tripartite tricarboxylate transporter substrate binding protein [Neoroseomonas terrae]
MITRRLLQGAALTLAAPASLRAQAGGGRPIRMLVGSAAGGSQDMTARLIAPGMSTRLGQNVVVENRGGGGGMLVFDPVMRAIPDGTAVTTGNMGTIIINSIAEPDFPIKPMRDLAPVSLVADVMTVLVVPADRPWRSVDELVAAARARPGELSWAHPGIGSSPWLAALLLDKDAGLSTISVPFRGGAPAVMELLAGRIDYCFATTPTALPHIRSGKLRALAAPTPERLSVLPEVSTMVELGYRDFLVSGWFAVLTTPGTPPETITRLNRAINAATADTDVIAAFAREGMATLHSTAEEFAARGAAEREKWEPIVLAATRNRSL